MRFFILVLLFISHSIHAEEQQLPVETAALEAVAEEYIFDATLEAQNKSTVSAQTSGRIIELPFDINDYVRKGDVIIRFRDTEQTARAKAAKANLSEAKARVNEADSEFKRISDVHKKGHVSIATLDRAKANLNAATARRDAAQASLKQAEEILEQTVIRAPYAGIVVERHVEIGELATPGTRLMTGLSLEHLRAIVDVPQSFIKDIRANPSAELILPDKQRLAIETLRIFPTADPATHTFRIRALLPEGQHGVFPGMLIKIAFKVGEKQVLTIPAEAIVQRSEVTAIYILSNTGDISFRAIRAGHSTANDRILVLAGLEPGEQVITKPDLAAIQLKQEATKQ